MRTAIRQLMDWFESGWLTVCVCVCVHAVWRMNMNCSHWKICTIIVWNGFAVCVTLHSINCPGYELYLNYLMDQNYSFRCLTHHINNQHHHTKMRKILGNPVQFLSPYSNIQPTNTLCFQRRIHFFRWLAIAYEFPAATRRSLHVWLTYWARHCPQHFYDNDDEKNHNWNHIQIAPQWRPPAQTRKISHMHTQQSCITCRAATRPRAFFATESKLIFVIHNLIKRNHGHNYV